MSTEAAPGAAEVPLEEFGRSLRALQDAATATNAPPQVAKEAARAMDRITELLRPHASTIGIGGEFDQYISTRGSHTLHPPFTTLHKGSDSVDLSVRFSPFYRNPFGIVHGGAIAMMFDTAIAQLPMFGEQRFLTANLSVDYRSPAPIDVDLMARIRLEQSEGRKRMIAGRLLEGETVLAEVHALFIAAQR